MSEWHRKLNHSVLLSNPIPERLLVSIVIIIHQAMEALRKEGRKRCRMCGGLVLETEQKESKRVWAA